MMNITIEQYNTAIEGQKMQSLLLQQQCKEALAEVQRLRAQADEFHKGTRVSFDVITEQARQINSLKGKIDIATQFAHGDGLEPVVGGSPEFLRLCDAIRELLDDLGDTQLALNELKARKRAKRGAGK